MPEPRPKFVIVIGHESSGTRLVAATISKVTGFEYDDGEHHTDAAGNLTGTYLTGLVESWWQDPSLIVCDHSRMTRRSLPHGGADNTHLRLALGADVGQRCFPDPRPLIAGLKEKGYDVYVVLTVRDEHIAIASKMREHTFGDLDTAEEEMRRAKEIIAGTLRVHDQCFVSSYESMMSLGGDYLQLLYRFLGVESAHVPELKDANPKYLEKKRRPRLPAAGVASLGIIAAGWDPGESRVLASIQQGLGALGVKTLVSPHLQGLQQPCDLYLVSHTARPLGNLAAAFSTSQKPFGLLPFHRDWRDRFQLAAQFAAYVSHALQGTAFAGTVPSIERLREIPEAISAFPRAQPFDTHSNAAAVSQANFVVASSLQEQTHLRRDFPSCKTELVHWDLALNNADRLPGKEFLQATGLARGEYLLHAGPLRQNENQLATILAAAALDMPLVLLADLPGDKDYELLAVNAAAKYRKAPTLLLCSVYPSQVVGGACRIVQVPALQLQGAAFCASAIHHAGLWIRTAFQETTAHQLLRGAAHGVHTIASELSPIEEFSAYGGCRALLAEHVTQVSPYHLPQLERAISASFGRTHPPVQHPLFERTPADVGSELYALLLKLHA